MFHDGLVRMCTEEYTKPTKQNLSMVCMHLTNYAVNKTNSNFLQPNAKSSDDAQVFVRVRSFVCCGFVVSVDDVPVLILVSVSIVIRVSTDRMKAPNDLSIGS